MQEQEKKYFDFKALMAHEVKNNIEVVERNEPNAAKGAEAFYNLFNRK